MNQGNQNKTDPQQEYALVLLVKEIMSQLDEVATLKKKGHSAALSGLLLSEMCSVLPELGEGLKEKYFDILVSIASKAEPVKPVVPSEDMIKASAEPKRKTIAEIAESLGVKAA